MPQKRYRNHALHTSVTRSEKELVRQAAKAAKQSLAAWIRRVCVDAATFELEEK